ncbi:uncharacterized protein LOC128683393 [Plodia interpunctella]|uniref:uncharacterized protein LOC128683393 n=1 Tax=Plodia interpunctella TaxID=58824 RepID=UPI0023684E13|nr:uncharacterized protein LOC128683393 [Plodia interpunctella]
MDRVAWCAALLALAGARVFRNCELAKELQEYGVERDHIATWVCIAFHESRLDTAAQNYGSGDHGIFQISELFWCGPGKACGVPCSAFRDDDIRDDIKCSLQIHEEHTRLQGNGFLAWVVYPQHCKQNTKKYLADCDVSPKNAAPKSLYKTNIVDFYEKNATAERNLSANNRILQDNYYRSAHKPSFLAISDIFQANFKYDFEHTDNPKTWIDHKIKNVDDLKLPQFTRRFNNVGSTTAKTKTWIGEINKVDDLKLPPFTTRFGSIARSQPNSAPATTTTARPIVPWRVIESNQFRNRIPQEGKYIVRSSYDKKFGVSRYDVTSKFPEAPKTTQSLVATTTYRSRESFPTSASYPRTTRTLASYSFPKAQTTLNLKASSIPPLSRNVTFNRVSFLRDSVPSMTTRSFPRDWTTAAPTTRSPTRRASSSEQARPTQSVFDLYLHPTTRPTLAPFKFTSLIDSPYKIKIFSGGTTTHAPLFSSFKG